MSLIKFAGEAFKLCSSGAMHWPEKNMLIVSDLHLEKGSSYAQKGIFLPPHETSETLQKLQKTCSKYKPEKILFLGDVFHDKTSLNRMNSQDREILNKILKSHNIVWVEGNHDSGHVPEGVQALHSFKIELISFNHIADQNEEGFEISGHYHPAVKFVHKEQKVRRPCFVKTEKKLLLPSFGTLTGGLDITENVLQCIVQNNCEVYALGSKSVIKINCDKII